MTSTAQDTAAAMADTEADAGAGTCSCDQLPITQAEMSCSVHTEHQAQEYSVFISADDAQHGAPKAAEPNSEVTQTGFPISLDAIFNIKLRERDLDRNIIGAIHTALALAQRMQSVVVAAADKDTGDQCALASTVQAGVAEVPIEQDEDVSVSSLDDKKIAIAIQANQWHALTPTKTIRRITCKDPSLLQDLQSYRPDAAATRYSVLLHDCEFDPERGIDVAGAVHRSYAAYDWNATYSLECDVLRPVVATPDAAPGSTEVEGAHGITDRQDYRHETMAGNANGSVMPMPGVGRVILMGAPMPYTQLPFLRYLASLPYEQLIIVDLRHPLEDTEPRKVHARYWEAITAEPDDLEDVLYDNMDDKAEWKAYHQDWLRVKKGGKKGAEHDAIGQVGLDLAAQQIRTGAPVEAKAKGDKAAQSKSEGETAVPHECGGTPSQDRVTAHPPGSSVASPAASMAITENGVAPAEARIKHRRSMQSDFRSGYIGRTYVDHVRFMRWYDGCAVERDDRARLMNMVLQALVPCAEQSMRMKTADEAAKVGIVIHCHNGAQRSGKLYIAMRYLASLTLGRDSLDISDLCPSLPSHGLETLPHWRDVENLNTQDSSIEPCASLPPLSAPAKCPLDILERAAHLLPMLELIDQAQEFRYGLTKDCQRPMLYDMVEIVMRRGMSKLSEREAWREQDESVFATEQVEALHGALYWPWRSVRVKREETKSVEGDLTQEGARKGIEELESEGRYWEEKRVRDEARKAKQSGLGTGEGTGENRS